MTDELVKEGMAQLKGLGFCGRCNRPFVRQWIKGGQSNLTGYEKICPGCMIQIITNEDE